MKSMDIFEGISFQEKNPRADPLWVGAEGRIIRFALQAGQEITEHHAPHSGLYIVVIKGTALISGADGLAKEFGENSLLVFDKAEAHSIKALDSEVVFLAFLSGVSASIPPENAGGMLGRQNQ